MSDKENVKSNDRDVFSDLEELASNNHAIRDKLITKLLDVANETNYNPEDIRASELESRLGIVSTIDSLMKSQESVQTNELKLKLQQRKNDDESDYSAAVLDLLQRIDPNYSSKPSAGDNVDTEKADEEIEKRINDEGVEISEGELEKVSVVE